MAVPGLRNRPVWRHCDMLCTSGPPIICQIMATKVGNLLKLICRSRASTRSGVKSRSAKKPYIPKTCVQKRHILGMLTTPRNDSCPTQNIASWTVFGLAKSLRRNSENSHECILRHTDSRLLFQTWSKSMQDRCPKCLVVLVTEKNKTHFGDVWQNPWGHFLEFFYVSAHCSHIYIPGFIQIR